MAARFARGAFTKCCLSSDQSLQKEVSADSDFVRAAPLQRISVRFRRALNKALWGDYFINMKQKKFVRGANAAGKKALFVSLILDNVWSVYESVMVRKDKEKLDKIISSLGLTIAPRDLRTSDARQQLCAIFSAWLPLASSVLRDVLRN